MCLGGTRSESDPNKGAFGLDDRLYLVLLRSAHLAERVQPDIAPAWGAYVHWADNWAMRARCRGEL